MKKLPISKQEQPPEPPAELIKVPGQITGFAYKKMSAEWDITFTVQKENLSHAQPLQDEMGSYFILCFVKVGDKGEMEGVMRRSLEELDINP